MSTPANPEDYRGQPALVASEALGWGVILHPGWGHLAFATAWVVCCGRQIAAGEWPPPPESREESTDGR